MFKLSIIIEMQDFKFMYFLYLRLLKQSLVIAAQIQFYWTHM